MSNRQPVLFVPHGAPTFALSPGAAGAALRQAAGKLPRPRSIVCISAHWDTPMPSIGTAGELETIYDFWGFPAPLYDICYPAHGDSGVADQLRRRLQLAGYQTHTDSGRGLDHGAWIPLRLMYPAADIPVVPLSIQSRLGPEHHFRLGRALAPLLEEGVLIVASGNITHNLRDFQIAAMGAAGTPSYVGEFAEWLWTQVAGGDTAEVVAYRQSSPGGVRAHPSEDHILPLHLALGAAGPAYRAERLYSGIADSVLAMDSYALWPAGTTASLL